MGKTLNLETKILDTTIKILYHKLKKSHPIHRHEYYEVEYVTKGSGTVIINNIPYDFTVGDAWFCTSTDFHETIINEDTNLTNISFKIDWIETELLNNLLFGTVIKNYNPSKIEEVCKECEQESYGSSIYIKHLLSCILLDFVRKINEEKLTDTYGKFSPSINQALRFIQSHFGEDISLNDVASSIGLSPSYFSSRFHSELGISFQSYIINLRLETAAKFLTSTNYSVTDICFLSGFNNYVNFSKAFKKRYNATPIQYRKTNSRTL